jgi:prohibitin 1
MRLFDNFRSSEGVWALKAYILAISATFFFFLLIGTIFGSFTVVGVGQDAIVTRFGTISHEYGSGIHFKMPFIESVHKFDVKTQKDTADAAAASQDLQDVKVTVVTNYHIEQGKVGELYRTVGDDYKARVLDPAIQESVKASTAKYPIAQLVTNRPDVKEAILKSLQARLEFRGIKIEDISLTNLEFSSSFSAAIERKQVAEQSSQQAKFAAEKAANDAQAEINKAQGDAEAQRLRQSTLTPELLQQQAIARWNGAMPTYYGGGNLLFNIPTSK